MYYIDISVYSASFFKKIFGIYFIITLALSESDNIPSV